MQHSVVDDAYQDIGVLKIIPPVWPDLPLSTYVPNIQLETL